jgi:hypothetical protein
MKVMNRTESYQVEALLELAGAFPEALTASEIARRRGVPAPFLGRLLARAARVGVVATARGPRGGFRLQRRPKETRLAELLGDAPTAPSGSPAVVWLADRLAGARHTVLEETTLAGLLAVERERSETDWQI